MRLGKALGSSRDSGGPRWVSECCVVLPGAAPGRLEPEPGRVERELARRARSCSRRRCRTPECHLRDTRQPLGSGRRAPPHQPAWLGTLKERARHSPRWARTLPRAQNRGCGAPTRVLRTPPGILPLGSCQSPLIRHSAAVMPTPPTLVPRFPASAFAAAAGRWRAGAGAVTGAVFNPVRATGI